MKNCYFIIHGSFSSPFDNWFPYLRCEIEKKDGVVYTPDMPSGVGYQTYNHWSRVMDAYVQSGLIDENTILFAHSIAPIFVCKFLVERKIKVKRLVLVCGFNHFLAGDLDFDTVNETMYFDSLSDVRKYCQDIVCFYSDNDPYVPFEKEKEFADTVADSQIVIPGGGHLNAESGYREFSDLLKYVE